MTRKLIASCALVLLLAGAAWAQAPDSIMYQGRLTDDGGAPITTERELTFTLWTDVSAGSQIGAAIARTLTPDAQGMFMVELGTLTEAEFDGAQVWLQIQITGEAAMTPRQLITSVPYAIGARVATTVPDGSISQAQIATNGVAAAEIAAGAVGTSEVANGSLTAVDLDDEAGVAYALSTSTVTLTDTPASLISATINLPAPGYVIATASGFVDLDHTVGQNTRADFSLTTTPGTIDTNSRTLAYVWSSTATGSYVHVISLQNVFNFSVAGNQTIHFNGENVFTNPGTQSVLYRKLTLVYVPSLYGTAKMADQQESGEVVPANGTEPNPSAR